MQLDAFKRNMKEFVIHTYKRDVKVLYLNLDLRGMATEEILQGDPIHSLPAPLNLNYCN
jgi:hypothetical protein